MKKKYLQPIIYVIAIRSGKALLSYSVNDFSRTENSSIGDTEEQ